MPQIWTDTYLNQLLIDAANIIADETDCIFVREYLAVQKDVSVFALPEKVRKIRRITWRGIELDPISWTAMEDMAVGLAFANTGNRIEGISSRPQYYSLHSTNIHEIKFYPTPNETFVDTVDGDNDPYSPKSNESRCTISYSRTVDTTDSVLSLPSYIDRRTRKAFVLWKAFGKEGKGQNSNASQYYKLKFDFLLNAFKKINSGCYRSIKYQIEDNLASLGRRPAKPTLGPNFERTILR